MLNAGHAPSQKKPHGQQSRTYRKQTLHTKTLQQPAARSAAHRPAELPSTLARGPEDIGVPASGVDGVAVRVWVDVGGATVALSTSPVPLFGFWGELGDASCLSVVVMVVTRMGCAAASAEGRSGRSGVCANARLWRQGQQETVIIHHLVAKGTIDEIVIAALAKKENVQAALMSAVKAKVGGVTA